MLKLTRIVLHNSKRFILISNVRSISYVETSDPGVLETMEKFMIVKEDFLSESDETNLLNEVQPYMKRLRYEFDHWDNAIHGYRETERKTWNENNQVILNRVKSFAFEQFKNKNMSNLLNHVHILDLHEDGFIKLHVDSTRFCGNTIAGLSLLGDCVMRLQNENDKEKSAKILLKRRSLYIMREAARYEYAHEILKNEESFFNGDKIEKPRRISIICRNESLEEPN